MRRIQKVLPYDKLIFNNFMMKIIRMKTVFFFVSFLFFNLIILSGQDKKSSVEKIPAEKLGTDDLFFQDDSIEMNVISASRSSKRIGELPITIYVVTREEIIRNHYNSLIDVIKSLPGVRVSQPGSGELGESFQLRGLIGNLYTMILINGLPIKPSAVIGMPILSQLPIRQAERIEVIYGPAAAVYGADAVSGVINIITKESDKGTFVMGDVSLGQFDYRSSNFMIGGKTGKNKNIMQYSFYGGLSEVSDLNIKSGYQDVYNPLHYLQNSGKEFTIGANTYEPVKITENILQSAGISTSDFIAANYPKNYKGGLTIPEIEDLPSSSNFLGFQLKYRDISLSFNNMYRRSHSSLGQSSYLFNYNNPQNFWAENIRSTTLSYNHEWTPKFTTTTNFSDLIYRMDNNSSMGVSFIDYTDKVYRYSASNDILIEQLFTVMPFNGLEIMSGITYQYSGILPQTNFLDTPFNPRDYSFFSDKIKLTDSAVNKFGFNPGTDHNFSLFTQTYYSVKSFRFMGGVRIDNNSHYGLSVSPRIAGLYIMNPRTSFRGSLGFAYKAPPSSMAWQSLAYRAGINHDSLIYISIPNPSLEPEKYRSVELGLIKKYRKGLNLNISIYYNEIRNRIMDRNIPLSQLGLPLAIIKPDTATVFSKINSQQSISRLYGLQATFKVNDIVKSIHMNGELSLTFAKSSEKFPEIFQIASNYLSNFKLIPNHFGQLKISMQPTKNLYIQVTSIWESSWLRVIIPFKELYNELIRNIDGFYSMDIVANYKIGINLNGFIKVNNIFDERYGGPGYSGMNTPLPYDPQIGRSIHVGLTYTLN
jgi:outer membrane receptor for ferrienterochelin and colicin